MGPRPRPDRIRHVGPAASGGYTFYPVLIIGAGERLAFDD
jgi:hypothetical protein